MNRIIISISIVLCIVGHALGQDIPSSSEAISFNFSTKSIEAYQEKSQNKIVEFYEYLTLYSHEENPELRKQIRENLFLMTKPHLVIPDFIHPSAEALTLDKFLSKIENRSWEFSIRSAEDPGAIGINNWVNAYTLSLKQEGETLNFIVNQTIYFQPLEKQFGSKSKTVWEMKLGDIHNEIATLGESE